MKDLPALRNFLSAYFHQDWALEHGSPDEVVSYFLDHESDGTIAGVRADLSELRSLDLDEDVLAQRLRDLGSEYDPTLNGDDWRGWLQTLAGRFG